MYIISKVKAIAAAVGVKVRQSGIVEMSGVGKMERRGVLRERERFAKIPVGNEETLSSSNRHLE